MILKYKCLIRAFDKGQIYTILGILVLMGFGCSGTYSEQNSVVSSEVFSTDDGFGYRILKNKKVLIQQNSIPAIQGNHPFTTDTDAAKTADLVIKKLLKRENPLVSILELKKLEIDIPLDKQVMK